MSEIATKTAIEVITSIQKRELGIEEVVKEYLTRIEKYDGVGGLNTVRELDECAIIKIRYCHQSIDE